jgi:hypothetical protein
MASASKFNSLILILLLHFNLTIVRSEDTFIRPVAGEVIPVNKPYTIQWETDSASFVEIELWNGNDKITNITCMFPPSSIPVLHPSLPVVCGSPPLITSLLHIPHLLLLSQYLRPSHPSNLLPSPLYPKAKSPFTINNEVRNIASTPNNGSFIWTPVSFFTRDNYFLAICPLDDSSDSCGYTFNGRFSIGSSAASSYSSSLTSTTASPSSTSSSTSLSSGISTSSSSSAFQTPSSSTGSSTTAPTNSPLQSSSPQPPTTSGLSTGAKIAIGILIPIFVIAASLLLFAIFRKNRKLKQLITAVGRADGRSDGYQKPELPTDTPRTEMYGYDRRVNRVELLGNGVYEAGSTFVGSGRGRGT